LLNLEDKWILSTLNRTVKEVNDKLASYTFDQAAISAYEFFWDKFCAYYVEISKPILFGKVGTPEQRLNKQKLLVILLSQSIRLLHPMAPFITEELFQIMKETLPNLKLSSSVDAYTTEAIKALQSPACIVAPYPTVINEKDIQEETEQLFQTLQQIIYSIRNIRGEMKLPPSTSTEIHITAANDTKSMIDKHQHIIASLVRNHGIKLYSEEPKIPFSSTASVNGVTITIPLPAELLSQEKNRLTKELQKLQDNQQKLQTQLSNSEFTAKAPPQLIEKLTTQLKQTEADIAVISTKLKTF
jgi:valyl-tRNA synthetase